jgi:hypothetical protein
MISVFFPQVLVDRIPYGASDCPSPLFFSILQKPGMDRNYCSNKGIAKHRTTIKFKIDTFET